MAASFLRPSPSPSCTSRNPPANQLRRALTATQLTLLGIGGVIGTGILCLPASRPPTMQVPALPLSFIVAGIGCTFAGLCYAEFAA